MSIRFAWNGKKAAGNITDLKARPWKSDNTAAPRCRRILRCGNHSCFLRNDRQDYFISIFYSTEDGGYIAHIPDLRFCSAFGATPEEALHEVQQAKAAWVESARASGKTIPKPQYRPAIYQRSSPPQLALA